MKVKIAVIGSGMIAEESYVPGIVRMPNAELTAVCNRSEDKARLMQGAFDIPRRYTSLDTMLDEVEFDLLVNLTPIQAHYEINLKALRAGKHLFTEKTLAQTVEQATELIETARENSVKLGSAPVAMLSPTEQKMKQLIEQGAIGKVAFARVISSNGGPAYEDTWPADPTWFYQEGAGPVHDMGVYGLHSITGLLGPAKQVTAFSGLSDPVRYVRGGPFAGKRIDVEVNDVTLFMLDFGDATFAVVDASFCVRATKMPSLASMEIYGADGTIVGSTWPAEEPLVVWRDDVESGTRGWIEIEPAPGPLDLSSGVEHMVSCILEDEEVIPSGEHARHVLEIIGKGLKAARTGQTQALETTF